MGELAYPKEQSETIDVAGALSGSLVYLDADEPLQLDALRVSPNYFDVFRLTGELWIPMEMNPQSPRFEGTNEIKAVGRLSRDASPSQASQELVRILRNRLRDFRHLYSGDFGATARLIPLHRAVTGDLRAPVLVLQTAVVFLLLMACANVANISLAGASTRRGELAIRSALGASRGRIMRQLTVESAFSPSLP